MKKVFVLLMILSVTLSCKKDDDGNQTPPVPVQTAEEIAQLLIGTWRFTSEIAEGEEQVLTACDLMSTATFSDASNVSISYHSSSSGEAPCAIENSIATYTLNNDLITVTFSDDEGTEITTSKIIINSTTLVVYDENDADPTVYSETFTRQ